MIQYSRVLSVSSAGAAGHALAVQGTASDLFVHDTPTRAVVGQDLADEHRQRLGRGVEPLPVRRQMRLERVEEALVGEQVEHAPLRRSRSGSNAAVTDKHADVVERGTDALFIASGQGSVQGGWSRLRFGIATRTYFAGASHCNPASNQAPIVNRVSLALVAGTESCFRMSGIVFQDDKAPCQALSCSSANSPSYFQKVHNYFVSN